MITRAVWPGWAHDPVLPPPLCHVGPAHRGRAAPAAVPGAAEAPAAPGQPGAAGASGPYEPRGGLGRGAAVRGGLVGGAVVFTGLASTPGGSSGYGYVGMDITDPGSWPRPFNPQPTTAWFCTPREAR